MITRYFHPLAGLGEATPTQAPMVAPAPQFTERPFDHAYQVSLTANQSLKDQTISMNGDAEFIVLALCGTQTGAYSIRLRDAEGYYLSSAPILNSNLVGTRQLPAIVFPELVIPRNGKISIDIENETGSTNEVELVFMGLKRFSR